MRDNEESIVVDDSTWRIVSMACDDAFAEQQIGVHLKHIISYPYRREPGGVIADRDKSELSAKQRRSTAKYFEKNDEALRWHGEDWGQLTWSPLTCGMSTTILWLKPPAMATQMVAMGTDAEAWVGGQI